MLNIGPAHHVFCRVCPPRWHG